jgi:hypothetical protein
MADALKGQQGHGPYKEKEIKKKLVMHFSFGYHLFLT